jgi:peptidyl-prolyl cis-trans isomerase SurA
MTLTMVRGRSFGACAAAALLAALAPVASLAQQAAPQATAPQGAGAPPAELGVAEPTGIAEGVAAIVNDDIISTYDLRQRMLLLIATTGVRPTEQTLPQIEREALRALVDERLQMQELRRRDVEIDDKDVEQELADIAREANTTPEAMVRQLQVQGISPQTLNEQVRAQLGWRILIRGLYGSRLRIGDDQINAALARLKADASKPQYLISEILIDPARVGGVQEALSGAEQLLVQMQAGAPFPAVARQFSAASTAVVGGDAGWISADAVAPELQQALAQLRPGQLSRPIQTREGVYILALRERRDSAGAPLVSLRQIALRLPAGASETDVQAAQSKLEALRGQVNGCADMQAKAATLPGAIAGDLGEAAVNDLAPQFRQAAETLPEGQLSAPIRTSAGMHLVAVCGRRQSGAETPSRDQIENRLFGQQLAMLSRRFLRDLRSSATIESR